MSGDLHELGAGELAHLVRTGKRRAEDIVGYFFDRIHRLDAQLNTFITVDRDGATAAAQAVDRAVAHGRDPGPLAGVPVALKDNIVTRGLRTTCGSRCLWRWIPPTTPRW